MAISNDVSGNNEAVIESTDRDEVTAQSEKHDENQGPFPTSEALSIDVIDNTSQSHEDCSDAVEQKKSNTDEQIDNGGEALTDQEKSKNLKNTPTALQDIKDNLPLTDEEKSKNLKNSPTALQESPDHEAVGDDGTSTSSSSSDFNFSDDNDDELNIRSKSTKTSSEDEDFQEQHQDNIVPKANTEALEELFHKMMRENTDDSKNLARSTDETTPADEHAANNIDVGKLTDQIGTQVNDLLNSSKCVGIGSGEGECSEIKQVCN